MKPWTIRGDCTAEQRSRHVWSLLEEEIDQCGRYHRVVSKCRWWKRRNAEREAESMNALYLGLVDQPKWRAIRVRDAFKNEWPGP